ncbi:transposase family protein [Domibacillus sp. A3M-37]|uniref:transposase family protein n=1 Tax=Domibacillus sp. A3M-37 TaxID=2962037 RepID=UPI0020B862C9|nr:transposase family protein [Domibacillus sp. A3M-37]MCP3765077.1 transposase family protein [Domibacillus sp. A3M-37]
MTHFLWSSPDPHLELLNVDDSRDVITLTVKSSHESASCPSCCQPSTRPHSRYIRKVQDLPISNRPVDLVVMTKKWFCDQPNCPINIFTERQEWLLPNRRRTVRAEEALRKIAFSTSCLAAEKVAKSLNLPVSHDALLSLVHRTDVPILVSPFSRPG